MHIPLGISCDTLNKSKKPWSNVCWLGEETGNAYSVKPGLVQQIQLQSGSCSGISKLNKAGKDASAIGYTYKGSLLYGILHSGDLFFWNQKTKILSHAKGIPELGSYLQRYSTDENDGPFLGVFDLFKQIKQEGHESTEAQESDLHNTKCVTPNHQQPQIFAADDCHRVIVVVGASQVYIWEKLLESGEESVDVIDGTWSVISCPSDIAMPNQHSVETEMSFCLCNEAPRGDQCLITLNFADTESLITTTLAVQWGGLRQQSQKCVSSLAFWHTMSVPFTTIGLKEADVSQKKSALISRYAHYQPLMCIAVNSEKYTSKMVYLHPMSNAVVAVNVENISGCYNFQNTMTGGLHWITDLTWSHDNTYLVGCLNSGVIFMATRMGPLLKISCSGENFNLQASTLQALHPHTIIRDEMQANKEKRMSNKYLVTKQQYFVTFHPYCSKFLLSSDLRVTVLSLPENCCTDAEVVDQLLMTAKHALYLLRHSSVTHDYAYIRCSTWRLAQSMPDLYQSFEDSTKLKKCEISLWGKEDCQQFQDKINVSPSEEEQLVNNNR